MSTIRTFDRRMLSAWAALFLLVAPWPALAACSAAGLPELAACIASEGNGGHIDLQADLSCTGAQCCPGGQPVLRVEGKTDFVVDGHGHRLTRSGDTTQCPALRIADSARVQLRNMIFQENPALSTAPCYPPGNACPSSIALLAQNSLDVTMDRVEVYDADGFAVVSIGMDGFVFDRSKIHNARLMGLFAGPNGSIASTGILIDRSTFTATATNAVTFYNSADSRISNSVFLGNHRQGIYYWCGQGGNEPCNGGQIYVPMGSGVVIENNIVGDGKCDNCALTPAYHHPVWAIEAGGYSALNQAAQAVNGLDIRNNYFYNHAAAAVLRNENSILNSFYLNQNVAAGAGDLYLQVNPNDRCNNTSPGVVDRDKCAADANQPHLSGNYVSAPYQLDRDGDASWTLYQLAANGYRYEARFANEQPQYLATHKLSLRPLAGVDGGGAIYRCWLSTPVNGVYHDYLSSDRNCEGGGTLDSVVGFSVGAAAVGAYPLYRCRNAFDHYVSPQAGCGGDVQEGLLGYAQP